MPPLVWVAVAWVAGLIAAHHRLVPLGMQPLSLAMLSLVPLAGILLWREDRSMRLAGACALAILLGALRYQAAIPNLDDPARVAHYNESGRITLGGTIQGYPDVRDTWINLRLNAESIDLDGPEQPVRGIVLVRAPRYPEYRCGDRLRVSGLLYTPPELDEFSYRD